jgi:hypothetical protein
VSGFADAMRRAGWGRDEAGDAARREELSGALSSPYLRRALAEEADRIRQEARRMGVEPLAQHPPVPGHLLTYRKGKAGTEVTCECGRWNGWFNGPRSRRRVLDDHAAHAAAELSAEGPIRIPSERADREPRVIEGKVAEE